MLNQVVSKALTRPDAWKHNRWHAFVMNTPMKYSRLHNQNDDVPDTAMARPLKEDISRWEEHVKKMGVTCREKCESSRPGESHPQALTEPDVNVSAHPALTVQPPPDAAVASVRRAPGHGLRWLVSGAPNADGAAADACISPAPNEPTARRGTSVSGTAPMDNTDRSTSANPG